MASETNEMEWMNHWWSFPAFLLALIIGIHLFIWGLFEIRHYNLENTFWYYDQCIEDNGIENDLLCRQQHGLSLEKEKFERQRYEISDEAPSPFEFVILKEGWLKDDTR